MANPFSVIGVPVAVNVSTSAALIAAIGQAKPGTVIILTTVVAPFHLALATPKSLPGICIVLPDDQPVDGTITNANLNTEIVGGTWSGYTVNPGPPFSSSAYGLTINSSASHFAIRGCTFSFSKNHITSQPLASYFEITNALLEDVVADSFAIVGARHFLLDDIFSHQPSLTTKTIGYFPDGRMPVDGVSQGSVTSAGGVWLDAAHADLAQLRDDCRDFRVSNFDIKGPQQGIVGYQTDEALPKWTRAEIVNNTLRLFSSATISAQGNDLLVSGNSVGRDPDAPIVTSAQSRFTLERHPRPPIGTGQQRFRVGLNVNIDGAFTNLTAQDGGALLDPFGPLNGDDVVPPALPNLHRLPWAPDPVRPPYVPPTVAPQVVLPPGIHHVPATPTIGTWITGGLGGTRAFTGSTGEWRFLRGATVVGTSRIYQIVADDIGQQITVETRRANAFGTGGWVASAAVVPT